MQICSTKEAHTRTFHKNVICPTKNFSTGNLQQFNSRTKVLPLDYPGKPLPGCKISSVFQRTVIEQFKHSTIQI